MISYFLMDVENVLLSGSSEEKELSITLCVSTALFAGPVLRLFLRN